MLGWVDGKLSVIRRVGVSAPIALTVSLNHTSDFGWHPEGGRIRLLDGKGDSITPRERRGAYLLGHLGVSTTRRGNMKHPTGTVME